MQYQRNSVYLKSIFFFFFFSSGTGLSLAAGAVFGWTFGQEFANHYLQLYRMDTLAAQSKFMEWWEAKCADRSWALTGFLKAGLKLCFLLYNKNWIFHVENEMVDLLLFDFRIFCIWIWEIFSLFSLEANWGFVDLQQFSKDKWMALLIWLRSNLFLFTIDLNMHEIFQIQ